MTLAADEMLIICAGARMDPSCDEAIELLGRGNGTRFRFVLSDWLTEDCFPQAALLWVVSRGLDREQLRSGMAAGLPVVVPEADSELKALCIEGRCGLYYRDAAEARECLEYLLNHAEIRSRMGANARAHLAYLVA
jgi:glycosyltransferase involved in cell wall biosynthesis